MIILLERWLLDTNIWLFGLRHDTTFPNCGEVLEQIGRFRAIIPLQVLKELNLNFTQDEINHFYNLVNQQPEWIELSWAAAPVERVRFYEAGGCRKGDAVIAAHAESHQVECIISENRQFLQTIQDLHIKILTPADALARLG